jgi:undecaprenyl-diphosphatase
MDGVMNVVTQMGSLLFAVIVPLSLIISGQEKLVRVGLKIALVLVVSETLVFLIKRVIQRPRPFTILPEVINTRATACQYSLPSGHTCAAFAMAFVLTSAFPGLDYIFFTLATLVGLSRMYLGVHYPSDVVAGMLIAYAVYVTAGNGLF